LQRKKVELLFLFHASGEIFCARGAFLSVFTPEAQNPAPEAEILQPGAEILCLGRNSHLLTPIIKGSGRSEIKIRFGHWKPKIGEFLEI
jgi:hypothetical protein